MDARISDWRYRLIGDPAAWLLDAADNPSVYFWFQRDIVGRPEDAPAMIEARGQIVYSRPVQELFSAQDPFGYWKSPTSLDLPRYQATMWSLALLAELGIPRTSRRAHAACEFVLQNHVNSDGAFTGLREFDFAGLALRSLVYFKRGDPRLTPLIERLRPAAATGNVLALWALAEAGLANHASVNDGADKLLDGLAENRFFNLGTFPSFDINDALLALRVLTLLGRGNDPRTEDVIERMWEKQAEGGRWNLDRSYNGMLGTEVEAAGVPSKWATLNVLRVATRR